MNIPILLGSIRRERQSPKVARFVHARLSSKEGVTSELIDLRTLDLPMMEERLAYRTDAPPNVVSLGEKLIAADAICLVTPEYNNGYPGVLKNALDYFGKEYRRKPFGIVTVSAGGFGGIHCLSQLRLVVLALGGVPIPASLPVSKVRESYGEEGPVEEAPRKNTEKFLDELLWWAEAVVARKARES